MVGSLLQKKYIYIYIFVSAISVASRSVQTSFYKSFHLTFSLLYINILVYQYIIERKTQGVPSEA